MNAPAPVRLSPVDVLYGLACTIIAVGWLLILFPQLREIVAAWVRQQIWIWQLGEWQARYLDLPSWQREGLEVRGHAAVPPRAAKA